MDPALTAEELEWLRKLDTDMPTKPAAPPAIAEALIKHGLRSSWLKAVCS